MKFWLAALIMIVCNTAAAQPITDSTKRDHGIELKIGASNLGIFAAVDKFFWDRIGLELNATSLVVINTVHLGPKLIIRKGNKVHWRVGAAASIFYGAYRETDETAYGFSFGVEMIHRNWALATQPTFAKFDRKWEGFNILSLSYRFKL